MSLAFSSLVFVPPFSSLLVNRDDTNGGFHVKKRKRKERVTSMLD